MHVRVKLMGVLRNRSPEGGVLDVPDGGTVEDVLAALGVPGDHVHLVMVNGKPEPNRERSLADGDELTVMPPVGGG